MKKLDNNVLCCTRVQSQCDHKLVSQIFMIYRAKKDTSFYEL